MSVTGNRKIELKDVLNFFEYEKVRDAMRRRVIDIKRVRRVAVGPYLSVVFENRDTVLFQIQEAKRWTFEYGFGIEAGSGLNTGCTDPQGCTGVSPRGTLNVTRINFRGRDESIIFKSHFGTLQRRACPKKHDMIPG